MYTLITVLIVLAALALVFVVVIQKSKGGGLAATFSSSNNIMGVRKTTDVLEKATWWLAGFVMVLCLISTAFISHGNQSEESKLLQGVEEQAAKGLSVPQGISGFDANQSTAPVVTDAPATDAQAPTTDAATPSEAQPQ